jgi:dihydrofolate reductase
MRKVVAGVMVSLDGVVEAPEAWTGPYFTPDLGQEVGATMAQADTMLLGRRTYETFAASFAGQSGGMADVMNSTPKLVASTTLEEATWQNSTLLKGDLADELGAVKGGEGKNINISGSATLIRSLLHDGLLDELRLLVFPVVVGSGARLFEGYEDRLGLALAESKQFEGGVVSLVYRPAGA